MSVSYRRKSGNIKLPGGDARASFLVTRSGSKSRIYADNAATSMIRPEALESYNYACLSAFGNPSSQHAAGVAAHEALEWARGVHAKHMGVKPETVYFTSCGTESNNIVVRGVLAHMRRTTGRTVVVTSSVEHSSVRKTAELAAGPGNHIMVPVDGRGYVNEQRFRDILTTNANRIALVSIILAQNEVGTLQRIPTLCRIAKEILGDRVPFHTDATQAFGKYVINPEAIGCDMMTASAHKYHGPRGVGILYAKAKTIDPSMTTMTGGGQERGCRSGTENVPAIVAAAFALERMLGDQKACEERKGRVRTMMDFILNALAQNIPDIEVNGDPKRGLYNLISVSLPGGKGAEIARRLDLEGICIGSGSACNKGRPSEAMLAMGKTPEAVRGTIRISLSEFNTVRDCQIIAQAVIRAWRAAKIN